MAIKYREATIKIKWYDPSMTVEAKDIQPHLNNFFRNWEDGRYEFPVEMVQEGMAEVINMACGCAISDEETKKHGRNTMIAIEGGEMNKAYDEASKRKVKEVGVGRVEIVEIDVKDKGSYD